MRGVDLEVRPGERRAVLGPNGAGKTTVFNLISGEFPPSSGRVELFGQDVTTLPARKRARLGLSRTFQTSRLFAGLSVEEAGDALGVSRAEAYRQWAYAKAWLRCALAEAGEKSGDDPPVDGA